MIYLSKSVVLITIDCLRSDHCSFMGYKRKTTPNIDNFIKSNNDVTICKNAYSNGPGTRWALPGILTGIHPLRMSSFGVPKKEHIKPFAKILSDTGFSTAAFLNNALITKELNFDFGFDNFCNSLKIEKEIQKNKNKEFVLKLINLVCPFFYYRNLSNSDSQTVEKALSWIEKQKKAGKDFFCWIHLMDAHIPYAIKKKHIKSLNIKNKFFVFRPNEYVNIYRKIGKKPPRFIIDSYDVAIRSADEQLGRILDKLNDEDIVILTSDHGEEFGEHTEFHMTSLYEGMARVPLVFKGLSLDKDKIDLPVQHIDILPTVLDTLNLENKNFDGKKLKKIINKKENRTIYLGVTDLKRNLESVGCLKNNWKFINNSRRNTYELYNLDQDPFEKNNLFFINKKISRRMKNKIDKFLKDVKENKIKIKLDNTKLEKSEEKIIKERLKELGYV